MLTITSPLCGISVVFNCVEKFELNTDGIHFSVVIISTELFTVSVVVSKNNTILNKMSFGRSRM